MYARSAVQVEAAIATGVSPFRVKYGVTCWLPVPNFIFPKESKVTAISYRDLLAQWTFYLCVRDQLVHFSSLSSGHLPDPLF